MTVLDLIKRSLRLLNALNVGNEPTADEEQDGLAALNAMVDAWGSERLTMFTTARSLYPVSAGVQSYTIGATGDWFAPRPPFLDAAGILLPGTPDVIERPLHIIRHDAEWEAIRIKTLASTLPLKLYYQADAPNATCVLWPVPQQDLSIALYTPVAVSQFSSLTQTVALPPGYAQALPFNLALLLAAEYDRTPSQFVVNTAIESKLSLKRANFPNAIGTLRGDDYCSAGTRGRWDWNLGEER